VIGVHHDLLATNNLLLAPVHEVILMHAILLPLARSLLSTRAAREDGARIEVIATLGFLRFGPREFLIVDRELISAISKLA
jgi:hypothetical protein